MMDGLEGWEKIVERFELCGGVISDADTRIVLLKERPSGTSSNLVSALRKMETYELIKDFFDCKSLGRIPVKGGLALQAYIVNRLKEEYAADKKGILPNMALYEAIGISGNDY